jgi:hypothetical protein
MRQHVSAEHRAGFKSFQTQRPTLVTKLLEALGNPILQTELVSQARNRSDAGRGGLRSV